VTSRPQAALLALALSCTPPPGNSHRIAGADTVASNNDTESPCPAGMGLIDSFCIDRYEAALSGHSPYEIPTAGSALSQAGLVPQGYISGAIAAKACEAAGKRLCTSAEWLRACGGPSGTLYPYGDDYDAQACNDSRNAHPIIDYFGEDPDRWSTTSMNDPGINQQPDTVDPAGANPDCVSAEGIYDLHGNLHEWVADPEGIFRGGFYADAAINGEGCAYRTTAHSFDYHDYSTGFRCCL
jgi:formylglycine-generating enzyme